MTRSKRRKRKDRPRSRPKSRSAKLKALTSEEIRTRLDAIADGQRPHDFSARDLIRESERRIYGAPRPQQFADDYTPIGHVVSEEES